MSFFGSDGQDHQIKHLKAQVSAKDAELNSLRNELTKKDELLIAEKRGKEDALYQLQKEADRAETAEKSLLARSNEVSALRQTTFNLESSLKTANEKLKKEEKETQRLQYELDCAGSSNEHDRTRKLQDEKSMLASKVKDLEATLRKKESEIEGLRTDGDSSAGWGAQPTGRSDKARLLSMENELSMLRTENDKLKTAVPLPSSPRIKKSSTSSNFFGSSPSPLPAKTKSRRRSTSLSVDPRVQDLEAELDHLRSTQHNSGELDGLKLKLAAAITARDKIENQKLALEKSSRRELEELRTRLEELTDEVEYHRSNGSSRDNGEVEKVKKDLGARIASLEDVLRRKTDEIAKLEKQVTRMEELEAELDSEKSARRDIEAASAKVPAQTSSPELAGLQDKVALLEVELSEARATTPSSGSTSSAKQLRQLQRELDAAKREKDALQSELDQSDDILAKKDEEILHLRGALPLPGSPALGATPVDDGRVKELELQVESLQEEIRNLEASGADTVRSLEGQLETAKAALEQAKSELESSRIEGDKFRADAESVISQCDALKAEVKQTREALSAKEQDITAIETDLGDVREQLLTERTTMSDLQAKLSEAANLSDARTAEMAATLRTMEKSMKELEASESSTKQKHDALMLDAQRLEQDVEKLQAQLNDAEQKAQEAIASMQEQLASATNSIKEEEATSEARRIELGDANNQLEQATTRADDLEERFRNAGTRIFELEALLAETQETLANRSTESEARGKDEAMYELKEKVEQLQQTLQQTKAEHEKDVSSVEFLRAQDSREATARVRQLQQRVSELEQRVKQVGAELAEKQAELVQVKELAEGYERRIAELQALPPSPTSTVSESTVEQEETKHIALMHAKIEKLRVERDDLRQKVSYLTHESRFALRAAEEDKASAMEDLQRARIDLKQKVAAHEAVRTEAAGLQDRLSTMTSRLESAEASFAAASTDKHDLADKVAHLELDLSRAQKERAEVDGTVALLLSRHARAELERDRARGDFSKAAKEQQRLEARIDRLQSAKDDGGDESGERGEDGEAIEGARSRKTSGTSSVADTEDHKHQVDDLRGRIERRDVTIANLQRELKKAKTSEAMACMAVTEHQAEMEEIQEALDVARADANAKDVELARVMGSLETMRSDLAQRTAELETSRSEVVVLRTADSELRTQVEKIQAELAAATSEVTELKASSAGIQQELDMARTAETTIRGQLDSTRAEAELLQEQLVTARQHAAESSAATIASLESDKTTLEARTKDLEDQLSEILDKLASGEKKRAETESTSGAELEEAKDRVVELEKVVVGKEEEIAQLKAQAETLVEELTQVESAHEEAIKRASDELGNKEKAHDEALKAMEEQREELRTQLEQDVNKSTELGSRLSAVQAEFEAEKIRAEAAHASSQERQSIIDDLRKTVSELENTSSQAGDKCSALEVQIAELQATAVSASEKEATRIVEMQQLEKAHSEAQASLTDMKTRLQQAETSSAGNDDVVKALREEVDKLAKQSKQAAGLLKFQENETKTISKALTMVKEELGSAQRMVEKANKQLKESQIELDKLMAENAKLKAGLANAENQADASDVQDLKERLQELEASLTIKVQEVDEADDRVREVYKANAKLEKKVAKLQRQLAATTTESQTALNTALNAKLSASAPVPVSATAKVVAPTSGSSQTFEATRLTSMAPPPVPASKLPHTTTPAAHTSTTIPSSPARTPLAPQPRAALRSVNIFDQAHHDTTSVLASTPGSAIGAKRLREEPADEKALPAEAIVLPPAHLKASPYRKASRPAFTPSRGGNVFASIKDRDVGVSKENANATPRTQAVFGGKMSTSNTPRNAFAPNPLPLPPRNAFSLDP